MYEIILIRYGEIALKGKNQYMFLDQLEENIKYSLKDFDDFKIRRTRGRVYLYPPKNASEDIIKRIYNLPGIVSVSPGIICPLDYDQLKKEALSFFKKEVSDYPTTFKVETKRPNKSFPKDSMEISRELGAHILSDINQKEEKLSVDVHNPDYRLQIEVRNDNIYIYTRKIQGPGGLPVASAGKGLLLLSGGIDSPVAGWLGMKRGMELEALYFHSHPYTGERAKEKVKDLARILSRYHGPLKLHIANFTPVQQAILKSCPDKHRISIMRRMMYRIAEKLAEKENIQVMLTGESVGQVSSQTLESINVIDRVVNIPVLRPVIGMNKNEIMKIAREIKTYETSIQPHEDCCTLFVPDSPITRPRLTDTKAAENDLNTKELTETAVNDVESKVITSYN